MTPKYCLAPDHCLKPEDGSPCPACPTAKEPPSSVVSSRLVRLARKMAADIRKEQKLIASLRDLGASEDEIMRALNEDAPKLKVKTVCPVCQGGTKLGKKELTWITCQDCLDKPNTPDEAPPDLTAK